MKFMKDKFKTVFARIFIPAIATSAVLIAFLAAANYSMLDRIYLSSLRKMLVNSSGLISGSISENEPFEKISKRCAEFGKKSGIRTTIVASDGKVVFDSDVDSGSMTNHLGRPEIKRALSGERNFSEHYSNTLKTKMLYIAVPAGTAVDGEYPYCVRQAMPLQNLSVAKKLFGYEILMLSAAAILLSAILSYFMARRIGMPLKSLSLAASKFAKGDFEARAEKCNIPEIAEVGSAMASMAADLKAREHSLTRRNCELDEIFSHMSDAVFICSSEGRILRMNSACAQIFSISKDPPLQTAEALRNSKLLALIEKTFDSGSETSAEIEVGSQPQKTFSVVGTMLPYESRVPRAIFVMHDISYISSNESLRREFVAGVSHELKTPITAIGIAAETLEETENPSDRRHFIEVIQKEVERVNMLVDDMLLLSKLDFAANMTGDFGELNVLSVIEEACISHQNAAEKAGDKISVDCDDGIYVKGDFTLLQIAVSNLIGNAIKYGGKGCNIHISGVRIGGDVALTVSDTGPGIASEHLGRLFERFYRVDKGRSRALGGTGLGLAIVKHIAMLHGGNVSVKSELGKGSSFTITLKSL